MPRIIQLGESQAVNKTSPSDWTTVIDGGLEIGSESRITLDRALIHKPGADQEQTAGAITIERDIITNIRAYVGMVASTVPTCQSGLANPQVNFKRFYAVQTDLSGDHGFIESLNIPIHVPAGTYLPANLCAFVTDQTRTPISLADVPSGSIQSPSTLLLKGGGQSPILTFTGGTVYDQEFILDIPLPPSPHIMSIFSPGTPCELTFTDPRTPGQQSLPATILSAPDSDGVINTSVNFGHPSPIPIIYIKIRSTNHNYFLRLNESDTSVELYPQGSPGFLARELFGCTTGVSFVYDEVTNRVQMSAHSPLYNLKAVSLLMSLDVPSGETYYTGTGPRGFLAFGDGAWGYSRAAWDGCLWNLLGFSYDDLNGSTDRTDSSGWVYSDAYIDSSFDLEQSNQVVGSPIWLLSDRSSGPQGVVLSLSPSVLDNGLWLIQISMLPSSSENRWVGPDGSSIDGIVGVVSKTFASGDFFISEGGPTWVLSKKQAPMTIGSVRVRILNAQDGKVDSSIGEGSMVLLQID